MKIAVCVLVGANRSDHFEASSHFPLAEFGQLFGAARTVELARIPAQIPNAHPNHRCPLVPFIASPLHPARAFGFSVSPSCPEWKQIKARKSRRFSAVARSSRPLSAVRRPEQRH